MSFVVAMALREMRASWRRLIFFFVCISIGVGAIVALRSVIQNVRQVFAGEARGLLAADLVLSSNRPVEEALADTLASRISAAGGTVVRSIELGTMVRADERETSRMVELRAVGAGFPFYGEMKVTGQPYDHALLDDFGALVRPELLAQLGIEVGDRIVIGKAPFTIRGTIESEPGRRLGAFSLGPRVFVDVDDLEQAGLITFGTRASYQQLVKVSDAALTPLMTALRTDTANTFVRVRSYQSTEDDIGEDFARAENYMSLVGLVIVILGGIGVSSVTRVFVQQKIRSIAVLKCVGASSGQLLAIYMAQVVALGLVGSAVGVLLAAAAIAAIPASIAASAMPGVTIDYGLTAGAVTQGLAIGLLVSVLFSLVPLLDVRQVKPSLLLRDDATPRRLDPLAIGVMIAVGAGLLAVTMWQAGSWRIGAVVGGGFVAATIVLHVAGSLLIRALAPLARVRWFPLRHAVIQLARPGSQARIVILAVGLGSFFIVGVRSLQETLLGEFTVNMSPDAPDMFLLDVQSDQVEPLRDYVLGELGPEAPAPRLLPVLRARVTSVQGRDVTLENYEDVRGRGSLAREYTITYRPRLEENETVIEGQFWDGQPAAEPEVSIEESIRDRFGIRVGDAIRFDVLGRTITARVSSVRHVEWADSRAGGFMFVFRPGVFEQAPHGYLSFMRGPEETAARARLQAGLITRFPNVSVIDGREMLTTVRTIVANVTLAVTVVGTLVVVSGLLILAGAVAMTKFRRVYEAAIFKTLGATRRTIASILLIEYGLLGALAGATGSIGASALTWSVSRYALDIPWQPLPALTAIGIGICAVVVSAVGVTASWDVLQRKPLATLRAE